jgi:hypothetical protein
VVTFCNSSLLVAPPDWINLFPSGIGVSLIITQYRASCVKWGTDMGAFDLRTAFDCQDIDLDASEDEVADFIECMLNELSLLAADRLASIEAQDRISEKIVLFETYFTRKRARMLC